MSSPPSLVGNTVNHIDDYFFNESDDEVRRWLDPRSAIGRESAIVILFVFGLLLLGGLIPFAALLLPFFLWLGAPMLVGLALIYVIDAARRQRVSRFLQA
jgi:hypothetical protein